MRRTFCTVFLLSLMVQLTACYNFGPNRVPTAAFLSLEGLTKEEIPPFPPLTKGGGEGGFYGLAGSGSAEARLRLRTGERAFLREDSGQVLNTHLAFERQGLFAFRRLFGKY